MKVETRKISDLVPDPNNARKHDSKNLDAIKGSLAKFGMQKPIVVDKNNIVLAGNGTLAAAKALGWTDIDVVVSTLEGFNAAAYALADNRSSELADWDMNILGSTLHSLREIDFELPDIGFDTSYVDGLLNPTQPTIEGSKELGEDEFSEFDNQCPKCGFEFDKA